MKTETKKKSSEQRGMFPLFSVIILTYMQRHLLEECLDSVFIQSYPNIELVICDDCSADFDVDEVKQYIEKNKSKNIKSFVVYKQQKNIGTVHNAQQGIELSSGSYFKLHAGDDMLFEKKTIEKVSDYFRDPNIKILAGRSIACQHDGTMTEHYYPSNEAVSEMMRADAKKQFDLIGTQSWGEFINAPAVFWKRDFFEKTGGYDLSYTYTEDWPMWLRVTSQGQRIHMLNEVFTIYRYGGISNDLSGLNRTLGKLHYQECIRMFQELVIPVFEKEGRKGKVARCRHCIHCLEIRMEAEGGNWKDWNCFQQVGWRVKSSPFLLRSWLYRRRKYGFSMNNRSIFIVMGACVLLYSFHVEFLPGMASDRIWAAVFFVAFGWLMLKMGLSVGIRLMNVLLNLKRRRDGI